MFEFYVDRYSSVFENCVTSPLSEEYAGFDVYIVKSPCSDISTQSLTLQNTGISYLFMKKGSDVIIERFGSTISSAVLNF